jgi:hypothetical protein
MALTLHDLAERYRVNDGGGFRLKDIDPADTWKLKSKEPACSALTGLCSRDAGQIPFAASQAFKITQLA